MQETEMQREENNKLPEFIPLIVTLKTGEKLTGSVIKNEEEFIRFMDETGKIRPLSYEMVEGFEEQEKAAEPEVEKEQNSKEVEPASPVTVTEKEAISQHKAGYITGRVTVYNAKLGFGLVTDGVTTYQFIQANIAKDSQGKIAKDFAVTFLPTMIYSKKKEKNVPAAKDISLIVGSEAVSKALAENQADGMEKSKLSEKPQASSGTMSGKTDSAEQTDGMQLTGKIEYYNRDVKAGNITVDQTGEKLNFSWKDLVDSSLADKLNCNVYVYEAQCILDKDPLGQRLTKAKQVVITKKVPKPQVEGAVKEESLPELTGPLCQGKIGYYNPEVKAGYLIYEGNKLNYSWKDFEGFDATKIDLDNYEYDVTFILDSTKRIIKATHIRVVNQTEGGVAVTWMSNGDATATNLLKFVLEKFQLKEMQAILSRAEQNQIGEDGVFRGEYEETKNLVQDLDDCGKKETRFSRVTAALKPNLPLAAAKIAQQYMAAQREAGNTEPDSFFNEKKLNQCLFDYAMMVVIGGSNGTQAERMYYAESVLNNDFGSSKYKVIASCISEYYDTATIRQNLRKGGYTSLSSILNIMNKPCHNADGLVRTLFHLPKQTFLEFQEEMEKNVEGELVTQVASELNCTPLEIEEKYKNFIRAQESIKNDTFSVGTDIMDAIAQIVDIFEDADGKLTRFLFEEDRQYLLRIRSLLNEIAGAVENESPMNRVQNLHGLFAGTQSLLKAIGEHPSRFSFEILRPFLQNLRLSMKNYLERQYADFAPRLTVEHYAISDDHQDETLEISNAEGRLPAFDIRIQATPYETDCFKVDDSGNRQISGVGRNINPGEAVEVRIPLVEEQDGSEQFELEINLSYKQYAEFDEEEGLYVQEQAADKQFQLQIDLTKKEEDYIQYNKYSDFAAGKPMNPENEQAEEMFFGREKDIADIYGMIVDKEGRLNAGSIVAIYGQKRCGKTSVMYFLGKKIEEDFPNALVINVNAQGGSVDQNDRGLYFRSLLTNICSELKAELRRKHRELYMAMREEGIEIPGARDLIAPGGEAIFSDFIKSFEAWRDVAYPGGSPIVLMVDEFTQAYIHMKSHMIHDDFLNRWRVMVQESRFVNIVVGQDFMDQFITDEEITSQNFGGAVNGLGTMGRKRLSYLDFESAREMIEKPIPFQDGTSRYRGRLGEMAVQMIYELTGGSAFYLMKFCNCLTDYMMAKREQNVTTDIVREVAYGYAFDTNNNPIEKKDFDPIYNEFSASENDEGDENGISEQVTKRMRATYSILKQIADKAVSRNGLCSVENIVWEDEKERREILRSLMVRGVLIDPMGKDITTENVEHITMRIKVGIFRIWLKERG